MRKHPQNGEKHYVCMTCTRPTRHDNDVKYMSITLEFVLNLEHLTSHNNTVEPTIKLSVAAT